MRLVIASRQSALARLQAYQVGQALQKKIPNLKVEFYFRSSLGDQNGDDPLWKMPEKGVFTQDFHQGLVDGEYDLVVHSWKDLPVEDREGTEIVATLPREDMRDLLLVKPETLGKDHKNFSILTSSPRRAYNLNLHLKKLLPFKTDGFVFEPVRGNIQTRLAKFLAQEEMGFVVAKAAMDRMLLTDHPKLQAERKEVQEAIKGLLWMALPLSLNPPAAAQGALAIEISKDREDLKAIFSELNCQESFRAAVDERMTLKAWGGGCHQKIGVSVLNRPYGKVVWAKGQQENGTLIDKESLSTERDFKAGDYFPQEPSQQIWFDRKEIPVSESWTNYKAHWVSRENALPKSVKLEPGKHIVWSSGLKTWQKLAERGIWVNGSSESLGEQEAPRLEAWLDSDDRWCKWTHRVGGEFHLGDRIASYELEPRTDHPVLSGGTEHFYWMSGSSFDEAVGHYPWLIDKQHWSGPGHTYASIKAQISKNNGKGLVHIALGFEQWQNVMKTRRDT